jgi:hypothetical protein
VSCIHRLTKDQRRQLRAYVESEEAERPISDTVTPRLNCTLMSAPSLRDFTREYVTNQYST